MTKYVRDKTVEVREENGPLWENLRISMLAYSYCQLIRP